MSRFLMMSAVWGFTALLVGPASAASLIDLQLVSDGSIDPPGDRIDVRLAFADTETSILLQVRAFTVTGETNQDLQPVAAASEDHSDDVGLFVLSKRLHRPRGARVVNYKTAIPYSSLKLETGTHRLGYEVRGIVADAVIFVRPTRLTEMQVTSEVREQLVETKHVSTAMNIERQVKAFTLRDGRLISTDVKLELSKPGRSKAATVAVHPVEIPQGFHRAEIDVPVDEQGPPQTSLEQFEPKQRRSIYFATNREVKPGGDLTVKSFSHQPSASLMYGQAEVNIPIETHRRGRLEVPRVNWWQKVDPKKHFFVRDISLISQADFAALTSSRDVLLYVHGYANTFEAAVLRAAQLQHDLEFPGHGACFSWPSTGSTIFASDPKYTLAYSRDEAQSARSAEALAEVIAQLASESATGDEQTGKLHIIAHSMGNRVLLKAVHELVESSRSPADRSLLGWVVLAAPDVMPDDFGETIESLLSVSEVVTYYYSLEDVALTLSREIHGEAPIGLSPFLYERVETINADNANSPFFHLMGHVYFASADQMLKDLKLQFLFGLPATERQPPLEPSGMIGDLPHWAIAP